MSSAPKSPSDASPAAAAETQTTTLESIEWLLQDDDFPLNGVLTVKDSLVADFTIFLLGAVEFSIDEIHNGGFEVVFSYSGDLSQDVVRKMFVPGVVLVFEKPE